VAGIRGELTVKVEVKFSISGCRQCKHIYRDARTSCCGQSTVIRHGTYIEDVPEPVARFAVKYGGLKLAKEKKHVQAV
jgi:hypothetical protein